MSKYELFNYCNSLYSFQRNLSSLCSFLPHLFFLILRNKIIYCWERDRLLSSCCFSWRSTKCLLRLVSIPGSSVLVSIPEMSPLTGGVCVKVLQCLREEGGKQNELCESCAKQKRLTSLELKSVSSKVSCIWIRAALQSADPSQRGGLGRVWIEVP